MTCSTCADVQQFAAGEDVLLDEVAHAGAELRVARAAGGDAVVQHQAAGLEQAEDLVEVARQHGTADVLEHAHRGDLVEGLALGQVAVVEQLASRPGRAGPARRSAGCTWACWFFDSVMPVASHAVVFRRPQQQRRPSRRRCRGSVRPGAASACGRCGRAWLPAPAPASCRVGGSRRRSRRGAGPATAHRSRPTRRSGTAPGARRLRRGGARSDLPRCIRSRHQANGPSGSGARVGSSRTSGAATSTTCAHRAFDVDAAFDIVFGQTADLPGRDMRQRRQAVQPAASRALRPGRCGARREGPATGHCRRRRPGCPSVARRGFQALSWGYAAAFPDSTESKPPRASRLPHAGACRPTQPLTRRTRRGSGDSACASERRRRFSKLRLSSAGA